MTNTSFNLANGIFLPFSPEATGVGVPGQYAVWSTDNKIGPAGAPANVAYDTIASFQAAVPPASAPVTVQASTGTWPPANGLDATPLTYRPVASTTGLYGEITVANQLYAPVYSTNPVNVGEFGAVGDANYAEVAAYVTATADGSATLTTASTAGVVVGMNIANMNWHSFAAAAVGSAGVIPVGTTVVSFVPNTSITVSNSVPSASNLSLIVWSETLTGTDNTAAIQAALDFAMRYGYSDIKFPHGKFLVSDTLNVGWGNNVYSLHLYGSKRFSFGGGTAGTVLFSTKTDRPLLSIAGSRGVSLSGLSLVGRSRIFTEYSQWFGNHVLSSDRTDWIDPRFVPTGNNPGGIASTAPYAAITQDAYAASQPTIHYPARNIPAWTGIASNYSAAFQLSSEVVVEDCSIEGFCVHFVSGLVNDIQGDFIKLSRLFLATGVIGVSINNNQSRNVEFRNIDYSGFHTLFSATALGQGDGEIVGPFDNIGGGESYQSFDIGSMGICGPLIISNHYFENQVRVGNFVSSQAFSASVIFQGGLWEFDYANNPASLITSGSFGCVTLNSVEISGGPRIANLIGGGGALYINGGNWSGARNTNASAAQLQAVGYCGGFLLGDVRFNTTARDVYTVKSLLGTNFTAVSGGIASQGYDEEINFHNSNIGFQTRAPMTQCAKVYTDTFGRRWRMTVTPEFTTSIANFASAPSYTNDAMTILWATGNQTAANPMLNFAAGDMLFHINTGTLFICTGVTGPSGGNYTISFLQQNNLQLDYAFGNTFVANLNPTPALTGGSVVIIKTGVVIPTVLEYGTFTSGSASVASVSDGSGTSHMASNYVVGDLMLGLPTGISGTVPYQQYPITPGSTISTVTDGTPGSLVLSKTALASGVFPIFPYELR